MKIRFLLHDVHTRGGGVLTVTFGLARDLAADQDHEVEIVSLFGPETTAPALEVPSGVRLTSLVERRQDVLAHGGPASRLLARSPSRVVPRSEPRYEHYSLHSDLALARYLRWVRGGAVVTMQPGLSLALARLGTRRYLRVAQEHRPVKHRKKETVLAYERYAGALDGFLTLNPDDADHYRRRITGARVARIANGAPRYDGRAAGLDSKVVIAAGRLVRSKGFHLLVRAWRQVADRHPDWELRIFGEGPQRDELADLVRQQDLEGNVSLMGYSTRLGAEMAEASCFALSSTAEGYPMVLLEAMACGLPLVSTDCPSGGPRDIIEEGVNGFLVPNRDVDGLAQALNRMIELDVAERHRMGRASLARASVQSPEAVAAQWGAFLQDLRRQGAA